jgi:hypothetical protein
MYDHSIIKEYLVGMAEMCQTYDIRTMSISAKVGVQNVRLQNMFIYLDDIIKDSPFSSSHSEDEEDYELFESFSQEELDDMIEAHDKEMEDYEPSEEEIAEFEAEQKQYEKEYAEEPLGPDWTWFYGPSGCGKTTLMKMYALAYAYRYYTEQFGRNEDLFGDGSIIENICEKLDVFRGGIPIYIKVKKIDENEVLGLHDPLLVERIIANAIRKICSEFITDESAIEFWKDLPADRIVYFIDNVEAFSNLSVKVGLIEGIKSRTYYGGKCYLSACTDGDLIFSTCMLNGEEKRYYFDELKGRSEDNCIGTLSTFKEKVCLALDKKTMIGSDIGTKLERYFVNDEIMDLVTTPLELTAFIMGYIDQAGAHFKILEVFRQLLETKIEWNKGKYLEVMWQLSRIAYKMATAKNPYVISHSELFEYIKEIRTESKSVYRYNLSTDDSSIYIFISFLCNGDFLKKQKEDYAFSNKAYQEYLVAYCIFKNNFFCSSVRKRRIEYVKEYILKHNENWKQVIIYLTFYDNEMREDVISLLFEKADQCEDKELSYYCLSILTKLVTLPNECFYENRGIKEYELRDYFRIVTRDIVSLKFLNLGYDEHKKIIQNRGNRSGEIFVELAMSMLDSLSYEELKRYRNEISDKVLYYLLNCEIPEEYVHKALESIYRYSFSTRFSVVVHKSGTYDRKRAILIEMTGNEIENSFEPNGYLLALYALLVGSRKNKPLAVAEELINKEDKMSQIGACGILFLATVINRTVKDKNKIKEMGYEIKKGDFVPFAPFLINGISKPSENMLFRYYQSALNGILDMGETEGYEEICGKNLNMLQI